MIGNEKSIKMELCDQIHILRRLTLYNLDRLYLIDWRMEEKRWGYEAINTVPNSGR